VFLHFHRAIIGLVLIDMCIDWCCRDDLVKFCTRIYRSVDVGLIEFLPRRVSQRLLRVCSVSVSVIELTCDVTIAVRAPAHSVGRPAVLLRPIHSLSRWSINSSQPSLLPRSVPAGPARAPVALHARCPSIDKVDQLFGCTTRVCVVALLPGFFCV